MRRNSRNYQKSQIFGLSTGRKGQAWSIDLIIGLLVFVLIIVIFYSLIGGEKESKARELTNKGDVVAERIFEEGLIDPVSNEFHEDIFFNLAAEDYEALRERLGVAGDFCLFLETNEYNSTVKFVVDEFGVVWTGIGSSEIEFADGSPCGSQWTP